MLLHEQYFIQRDSTEYLTDHLRAVIKKLSNVLEASPIILRLKSDL